MGGTIADGLVAQQTAILIIELNRNYRDWKRELSALDTVTSKLLCVQASTHEATMRVDYPWLRRKQEILYLSVPTPDMCADAQRFQSDGANDGVAVDSTAKNLAKYSCNGVPSGWSIRAGENQQALAQSYSNAMLANSAKRRQERFQENKTRLVLKGHQTARMSLTGVVGDLNAAVKIHDGLSDTFARGFQAAGIGLGTITGKWASSGDAAVKA